MCTEQDYAKRGPNMPKSRVMNELHVNQAGGHEIANIPFIVQKCSVNPRQAYRRQYAHIIIYL